MQLEKSGTHIDLNAERTNWLQWNFGYSTQNFSDTRNSR